MDRRQVLAVGLLAVAARGAHAVSVTAEAAPQSKSLSAKDDERLLRQSVARWCLNAMTIEQHSIVFYRLPQLDHQLVLFPCLALL